MYLATMNHYIEEKASHTRQVQNRRRPKQSQKQQAINNKWSVTYMQAVKGTTAK